MLKSKPTEKMDLTLAISPCPNDTYMFDAIVNRRIELCGLKFSTTLCDIEELNAEALNHIADISKISYALYPLIADNYVLLNSGSALGRGCGPLLVSKHKIYPEELKSVTIATPGAHTTASMLLKHAFGEGLSTREYLFSDICDVVASQECDAGIVIHEERFTYKDKGLRLVADLGQLWEQSTSMAIPLGAIVARRSLGYKTILKVEQLIKCSIEFADANPTESRPFIKEHARSLSDDTINKHIAMFVNEYSKSLGVEGRQAVAELFAKNGYKTTENIWLNQQ